MTITTTPKNHRIRGFQGLAVALLATLALTGCTIAEDTLKDFSGERKTAEAPYNGPAVQPLQTDPNALVSTVVRVIDGDTLAVTPTKELPATNEAGDEHVIRLLGIDAPEMNSHSSKKDAGLTPQCGAQEATDNLADMLLGFKVTVVYDAKADKTDKYNRSLAYVGLLDPSEASFPGNTFTDANMAQVALGHAEAWFPQGEPTPERYRLYTASMQAAEHEDAGSWASCDSMGR